MSSSSPSPSSSLPPPDLGGGLAARGRLPLDLLDDGRIVFLLLGVLEEIDHRFHLTVGDKAALHTQGLRLSHRHKEHIAVAEQALRAARIQDGAGVHRRGHGEGQAAGDVRFDEAG